MQQRTANSVGRQECYRDIYGTVERLYGKRETRHTGKSPGKNETETNHETRMTALLEALDNKRSRYVPVCTTLTHTDTSALLMLTTTTTACTVRVYTTASTGH